MKKALAHTKCMVKLRKSEYQEEWYLILESYPVFEAGKDKAIRKVESLKRTITTPIWDKTRTTRYNTENSASYKPKRDINGIIQCRSSKDMESCIYADKVRALRQHEYDNAALYSETDAEQAAQLERSKRNFIEFVETTRKFRHKHSSKSININWSRLIALLEIYTENCSLPFSSITLNMIEDFRMFLLDAPQGGGKPGTISQNTASTYFSIFKAALKQAFVEEYLTVDLAAKVKNIPTKQVKREYLTFDELNTLAATPCDKPIIKRAALFSALTGLRHVDIQKMKWKELFKDGDHYQLNFIQKKTQGVVYMPISEQAYKLCGERRDDERLVFDGLPAPAWISDPLTRWIKASGITKHITFHCFRHTYATLQITKGTDIYTVSKMLGHTKVTTTQIYANVIDEKKKEASNAIVIDDNNLNDLNNEQPN